MTKRTKAKPEHYVNNKEFTAAIAEHNNAVKKAVAEGKAVSINKQQELTLKFLGDRVNTLEDKIENLRDKLAEMKANGNGAH